MPSLCVHYLPQDDISYRPELGLQTHPKLLLLLRSALAPAERAARSKICREREQTCSFRLWREKRVQATMGASSTGRGRMPFPLPANSKQ